MRTAAYRSRSSRYVGMGVTFGLSRAVDRNEIAVMASDTDQLGDVEIAKY